MLGGLPGQPRPVVRSKIFYEPFEPFNLESSFQLIGGMFLYSNPLIGLNILRISAETPIDTPPETPIATTVEPSVEPPVAIEDEALKTDNLALRQDKQGQVDTRETYTKAGDEGDRFNTTVERPDLALMTSRRL